MTLKKTQVEVTVDGKRVRSIPAESVAVPFGRGAPIGMTDDGTLYAAFHTEGPALESELLASADGGRTWSHKRLDWWQFSQRADSHDSLAFLFWDNRWAITNDSFGVLRDGTLLWAFLRNSGWYEISGLEPESYVIRSEDRGETWDGPVKVDKSGFPSVGVSSNRMTQLPDGTVLWPQRLGLTSEEIESIRSGQSAAEHSDALRTYVFRSTDEGRTWGDLTPLPEWCFETTLLRLQSGRIVAALRYQPFADVDEHWGKYGKRVFLADSDDDGRTWVDFRPVRRTPDGPPDLEFGQCHGELSELSDGTLVLTYDHRYPYERQQVLARISHDQGQTWTPEVYNVAPEGDSRMGSATPRGTGSGYASSVVLEDDTIVTMTGAGSCLRWRVE